MGDQEPRPGIQYRRFEDIADFLAFAESEYGAVVDGFMVPVEIMESYADVKAFWCKSRGVEEGNISRWVLDKKATNGLACDDMDTSHGEVFVLIDELEDPQLFWDSIPRHELLGVHIPPIQYVRDLLQQEQKVYE